MLNEPDFSLLSFPGYAVFIPDMMFAIVGLHNYSKLYDGKYADSVSTWLSYAKANFIHQETGLMVAKTRTRYKNSRPLSGAYTALTCYCLTKLTDTDFAQDQFLKMKHHLMIEPSMLGAPLTGIREKLRSLPQFTFDPDAGPIVCGLSASGTAWAVGSATYFGDWEFRSKLLRTAEVMGRTTKSKNMRHYRLGSIALVGEAVELAMRTNRKQ
jgi:hypothetical protein